MTCKDGRFNTGNKLCSNDLRDLNDNSIIVDGYVNSDELYIEDRLGVERLTLAGIESINKKQMQEIQDHADSTIGEFDGKIDAIIKEAGGVEITNEFGNDLTKVINQDFITKKTMVVMDTLDNVRSSTFDHDAIVVNRYSADRNTGGGIYLKTASGVDNGGSIVQNANGTPYEIKYDKFNVNTWGIVGDNTTDNSDQMNKMLTFVGSAPFFSKRVIVPNGAYVFKSPIYLDTEHINTQFVGIGGSMTTRFLCRDEIDDRHFIDCKAEQVRFKGIRFGYLDTKPNSNTTKKSCFNFHKDIGVKIDIDATIEECYIYGFNKVADHKGRGLLFQNNTVDKCFSGIDLDFPNEGDFPINPGGAVADRYDVAWRAIRIINNRAHSITSHFLINNKANKSMLNGLEYTNLNMDFGASFFTGDLGKNPRVADISCLNSGHYTSQITGANNANVSNLNLHSEKSIATNSLLILNGNITGLFSGLSFSSCKTTPLVINRGSVDALISNVYARDIDNTNGSVIAVSNVTNSNIRMTNIGTDSDLASLINNASDESNYIFGSDLFGARSAVNGISPVVGLAFRGTALIPLGENHRLGSVGNPYNNIYSKNQISIVP